MFTSGDVGRQGITNKSKSFTLLYIKYHAFKSSGIAIKCVSSKIVINIHITINIIL